MLLLVTKTYSNVEFADDDSGDYAEEHAFLDEGSTVRVADVIRELRGEWRFGELSSCPVSADHCHGVWVTRHDGMDCDGVDHSESYHIKRADGRELSSRALYRILRAAGLAGERAAE